MNTLRRVPPSLFSISFGIAGLAVVWSLAGQLFGVPAWIGEVLFAVAAVGWSALLVIYAGLALVEPISVARYLRDPALGPFFSLAALIRILLAMGLEARARGRESAFSRSASRQRLCSAAGRWVS